MTTPAFSLVMPAYNEEGALVAAVERTLAAANKLRLPYELVIVNDASRDRTGVLAEELHRRYAGTVRVVHNRRNQRLGGAILRGIRVARAERCLVCYVDSPQNATQMRAFLAASDDADIVAGYRSQRVGYSWWMRAASRWYWWCLRALFHTRLKDLTWVCLYRKTVFKKIRVRFRWVAFFPEVLLKAERAGFRVREVRCDMRPRTQGIATVSRPHVVVRAAWDTVRLWRELQRTRRRM